MKLEKIFDFCLGRQYDGVHKKYKEIYKENKTNRTDKWLWLVHILQGQCTKVNFISI